MRLYIDPGTGSMLFAILIGIFSAVVYMLKSWIIKLRFILSGGKQVDSASDKIPLAIFVDATEKNIDTQGFIPLFMVKDFDSDTYTTSDEFMTDADVPTLATNGLIDNPVNPFTGNAINSDDKTAHDQYLLYALGSNDWSTDTNNGQSFLPADWYTVHDNIWDRNNWTLVSEDSVLMSED